MSDKKISQLTGATTPLAGSEELPVVQSGSTKKVSVENLTANRDVTTKTVTADALADGLIVTVQRDGLTVGGVGSQGGDLFVSSDSIGMRFRDSLSAIIPSVNGGTGSSGIFDLGNDTNRWRKLYLSDNLVIGTAGNGIDFSADSSAAGMTSELLDDYEEGTWTPAIEGTTTAGTATYATQNGRYTKIGNRVYVSFFVNYSSHTGTGNMKVTGLPFAAVNLSLFASGSFGAISGLTLPASHVPIAYVDSNAATMTLASLLTGGTSTASLAIDAAAAFAINADYQAA